MLSSRVSKLMKLKTLNCQHIYSTIHAFVKLQSQCIRCLADFRRHFFSLSHTASVSSSLRQRWNWRVIHQWNVASSNSLNRRGWANKARESPPSAENFIRNSNWSRAKPSVFVWCKYTPWVLKYPATEQSNYAKLSFREQNAEQKIRSPRVCFEFLFSISNWGKSYPAPIPCAFCVRQFTHFKQSATHAVVRCTNLHALRARSLVRSYQNAFNQSFFLFGALSLALQARRTKLIMNCPQNSRVNVVEDDEEEKTTTTIDSS